ncbi:MAG: carbon monoxide dehydrogenase [Chloroflexi bacterium]|nr:carbon monoxide dehydrogenase [Chloroflexota bacterium]
MIPSQFTYHRPKSLTDALSLMRQFDGDGRVVSGGMSLVPAMKLRLIQPDHLIDIGKLKEIRYIKNMSDGVAIGAGTTYRDLIESKIVLKKLPLLAEAASLVGDTQIRNRGSIGGSAAHADPAADLPAVLSALDARFLIKGGIRSRNLSAKKFFVDAYETDLHPSEILTEIIMPSLPQNSGTAYVKFANKASRFAIVGAAVVIATTKDNICNHVRISLTGAGPKPQRLLVAEKYLQGTLLSTEAIDTAIQKSIKNIEVLSDIHGSEEYRLHLSKVISARACNLAWDRLRN